MLSKWSLSVGYPSYRARTNYIFCICASAHSVDTFYLFRYVPSICAGQALAQHARIGV